MLISHCDFLLMYIVDDTHDPIFHSKVRDIVQYKLMWICTVLWNPADSRSGLSACCQVMRSSYAINCTNRETH